MSEQAGNPKVQGRCPWCGADSLFLGDGGFVTCSVIGCARPAFASELLVSEKLHRVIQSVARELIP